MQDSSREADSVPIELGTSASRLTVEVETRERLSVLICRYVLRAHVADLQRLASAHIPSGTSSARYFLSCCVGLLGSCGQSETARFAYTHCIRLDGNQTRARTGRLFARAASHRCTRYWIPCVHGSPQSGRRSSRGRAALRTPDFNGCRFTTSTSSPNLNETQLSRPSRSENSEYSLRLCN
jgi:hypothetical protein